jgi:hypothetical protein
MDLLQGRHGVLPPDEPWPPPQTREALDGPHRGGNLRPPTSGMLPGDEPGGPALLLALVADHSERDEAAVRTALAQNENEGRPLPRLTCCSVDKALMQAYKLHPDLVVLGSSASPAWPPLQVKLCRRLKEFVAAKPPIVLLFSDQQAAGAALPVALRPDAVVACDLPCSQLAGMLDLMIILAAFPLNWQLWRSLGLEPK